MRAHVTLETEVFGDGELLDSGSSQTEESKLTVSVPELFTLGVDELKVTTTVEEVTIAE